MTEAMKLARRKTVMAASGLTMLCCVSLMGVAPTVHRLHVPVLYGVVPMMLLEVLGLTVVVRAFVKLMRFEAAGESGLMVGLAAVAKGKPMPAHPIYTLDSVYCDGASSSIAQSAGGPPFWVRRPAHR